jgi:hypothetical protein
MLKAMYQFDRTRKERCGREMLKLKLNVTKPVSGKETGTTMACLSFPPQSYLEMCM